MTTWRSRMPDGQDAEALSSGLERRGFLRKSKPCPLVLLRRSDDTEIVLGVRTRAIVIRVPLTIPEEARQAFAEETFLLVGEVLVEGRLGAE